jgi:cell fate (sporulation/competence/biofilm development) regulator YlbF (YheA/YmcA/DUF963 family)
VIPDKARELGRLIGQSDEYAALRRAQDRVAEAPELREKLDRLRQLADTLERVSMEGGTPQPADVTSYDQLLTAIQGDTLYQSVLAAQTNFDKLMIKVNDQIMEGIRKGATSSIITLG